MQHNCPIGDKWLLDRVQYRVVSSSHFRMDEGISHTPTTQATKAAIAQAHGGTADSQVIMISWDNTLESVSLAQHQCAEIQSRTLRNFLVYILDRDLIRNTRTRNEFGPG